MLSPMLLLLRADQPYDTEEIISQLRKQWQALRARSDEELGGLDTDGGALPAREELDRYVNTMCNQIQRHLNKPWSYGGY